MLRFLIIKFFTYYQRIRSSSVITLGLYVLAMSRTSFRVNPHSIVCLNVKELLTRSRHHIWSLSDSNDIQTHNHIVHKRTVWLNGWVFVYELCVCGFGSRCCHLAALWIVAKVDFRKPLEVFMAGFEQQNASWVN